MLGTSIVPTRLVCATKVTSLIVAFALVASDPPPRMISARQMVLVADVLARAVVGRVDGDRVHAVGRVGVVVDADRARGVGDLERLGLARVVEVGRLDRGVVDDVVVTARPAARLQLQLEVRRCEVRVAGHGVALGVTDRGEVRRGLAVEDMGGDARIVVAVGKPSVGAGTAELRSAGVDRRAAVRAVAVVGPGAGEGSDRGVWGSVLAGRALRAARALVALQGGSGVCGKPVFLDGALLDLWVGDGVVLQLLVADASRRELTGGERGTSPDCYDEGCRRDGCRCRWLAELHGWSSLGHCWACVVMILCAVP